jgi:uncharacterized membrane protein
VGIIEKWGWIYTGGPDGARTLLSAVAVLIRMLEAIARIAKHTYNNNNRAALRDHADMIWRNSQEQVSEQSDRNQIEQRYNAAIKVLESFK